MCSCKKSNFFVEKEKQLVYTKIINKFHKAMFLGGQKKWQ